MPQFGAFQGQIMTQANALIELGLGADLRISPDKGPCIDWPSHVPGGRQLFPNLIVEE
jgi:hypothetical protein